MKNTAIYIICLLCFLPAQAQNLYFKHVGIADGLSQTQTQTICQDETGAVWIGTAEGLHRYNGTTVNAYSLPDTLQNGSTGSIDQLCGNGNGRLYILSQGKAIEFDLYSERFSLIAGKDVRGLFSERDTLWLACRDGIYYHTGQGKELTPFARLPKPSGQATRLYAGKDTVWALSPTHIFAIPRKNPSVQRKLAYFPGDTQCLFVDTRQNIWVGTWNGVYRLTPSGQIVHYTSSKGEVSHNQIRSILEDNFGDIWIGTFKGIDCYHPESDTWDHHTEYGDSPNTLSHNSILTLHKDRDGNIWAGTYFGGVNIFNPDPKTNYFYHADPLRKDWLNFAVVGKMTEDQNGNLWICTEGGGLNRLDTRTGKFSHYIHQPGNPRSIGSDNLKAIYFHPETEKLYVGTHLGGLYILDTRTGEGHTLRHIRGDASSLPHNIVNEIQPYRKGLLVLTQGGLVYMDTETEKFSKVSMNPDVNKILDRRFAYETFLLDSRNRLWLGQTKGGVTCVDLSTFHVSRYRPESLSSSKVTHIFEDRYGEIYIGTAGAGLLRYQRKEDTFKQYSTYNGTLSSNFCYYIGEAKQNNCLYLIHGKGISLFNTQTETIENTYRLFNQSYSTGSSMFRDRKGTLYIGGINGMAVLFKEYTEIEPPSPCLDRLFVFNRNIRPGDGSGILSRTLGKTDKIELKHDQNNLTVEVTAFHYMEDIRSGFEYKMEGFDKSWSRAQGTQITYTHLSPGNYTLKVRPVTSGKTPAKEAALEIHVSPPFYASVWAYLLYACMTGGILFVIVSFIIRQTRLYSSLELAKKEKRHIEEVNRMKIDFFTNVSHEFMTPLTLILGQLETMMQSESLSSSIHNKLARIYRNAWGMRKLISELMSFRKQGQIMLKVEGMDLVEFTKQTCLPFNEYAHQKDIGFKFSTQTDHLTVWFDPAQIQKVISNLLLNMMRCTPAKGCISVEVQKTKDTGTVILTETGEALSDATKEMLEMVNGNDNAGKANTEVGIGFSIAKNIIERHHGSIHADTVEKEKGCRLTVSLLLGQSHFSEEDLAHPEDEPAFLTQWQETTPDTPGPEEENNTDEEENNTHPILLLIEDNKELCSVLQEALGSAYHLYIAHNGQEGWEKAQQIQPDLIICEATIPGMSGKELCYKVKNNVELANVSVILVAAQTSTGVSVEAYRAGADAYVTKPFDIKMLMARCRNLLKNRNRLMAYYTNRAVPETSAEDAISEADKKLLQRCIDIIRENFSNPEFDVTALANALCMGRSKLYAKFKQLAGLPPNEFILKIKMEEAMSLLKKHPELNVSEVAMNLGFSSPRYFSKLFKAFFGTTPQSVRNKKEE